MITSATAMVCSETTSRAPSAPRVSTLISCPISSAVFFNASAAMRVWAIPVGHAVTATILLISNLLAMLR